MGNEKCENPNPNGAESTEGALIGRAVLGCIANALTRCQAPSKSNRSTRSTHLRRCLAPTWRSECEGGQPAGGSGCGRGRVRRPCPILYAGSEALRPPAGDGWSPRPPAASNRGKRHGEKGAMTSGVPSRERSARSDGVLCGMALRTQRLCGSAWVGMGTLNDPEVASFYAAKATDRCRCR